MRQLSPIRSVSPNTKPKIVFNYPISPLRERKNNDNSRSVMPERLIMLERQIMAERPINRPSLQQLKMNKHQQQKVQTMPVETLCFFCNKSATYRLVKHNNYCCSHCAINQMKHGAQVVRLELRDHKFYQQSQGKYQKQNTTTQINMPSRSSVTSPKKVLGDFKKLKSTNRETQVNNLVSQINKEEKQLSKMLDLLKCDDYREENIKLLFKQKKIGLKHHYQKIKIAIKISIQKDLDELDRREKQTIANVEHKILQIKKNLQEIKKIKQDIEPNKQQIIQTVQDEVYSNYIGKYKAESRRITEQSNESSNLINQISSASIDKHSSDYSQHVKLTNEHLESAKAYLYQYEMYMMFDGKTEKKGDMLFSFQRK